MVVSVNTVTLPPLIIKGAGEIEVQFDCHDSKCAKALAIIFEAAVISVRVSKKDG